MSNLSCPIENSSRLYKISVYQSTCSMTDMNSCTGHFVWQRLSDVYAIIGDPFASSYNYMKAVNIERSLSMYKHMYMYTPEVD